MATTSNVSITQGTGKNAATYSFTEDAVTKDVARAVLATPTGVDINPANPLAISWIGSTAATVGQKTMTNSVPVTLASDQGTIAVSLDPGHTLGTVNIGTSAGTIQVFLPDTGHTLGKVDAGLGTFSVQFDPGHELGSIRGNTNTLTVFLPDTGHEIGSIRGNTNTLTVFLPDTGHTLGKVDAGAGTFQVFLPDTGHEIGSIRGNTNTLTIFIPDTGHTIGKADQGVAGSVASAWFVNQSSTAGIFTTSGSANGVSVSGNTVIAPSSAYNFKIYAFGLTTTAQSNIFAKFTNGAGTSPTEFARYALQAPSQGISGANLAVTPPGYLFATGTNTTLALVIDSASLIHYWVSYVKESA